MTRADGLLPPLSPKRSTKPGTAQRSQRELPTPNNDGEPDDAGESKPPRPPSFDADESTYTSLIQQYLALLCHDNAAFLAERLVALRPNSENATYLLAFCHYRSGSPKRARSVLLSRRVGRSATTTTTATEGGNDAALERIRSSTRYLLAKCCYDLCYYGEAEEALLRDCRQTFTSVLAANGGALGGGKVRGSTNEAMDAWVMRTTPCPIPNGAAGLNLLGNICRKSNRRQRAMEYYRQSLKLDPLLWSSYESLCELGGSGGGIEEADDPAGIFGVTAPTLSPRTNNVVKDGAHFAPFAPFFGGNGKATPDINESSNFMEPMQTSKISRYGTPSTPYNIFGGMKLDASASRNASQFNPAAGRSDGGSDAHYQLNVPATASTTASRARGPPSRLPQTNLFSTPSLTTPNAPESAISDTHSQKGTFAVPDAALATPDEAGVSAIDRACVIIHRARRVAARQYYEPSPETTPPNEYGISRRMPPPIDMTQRKRGGRRRLAGSNAANDISGIDGFEANGTMHEMTLGTDLSFSSTLPGTPAHAAAPPFHAGVSSVKKGDKRGLFHASNDVSFKRIGVEKEKHQFPAKVTSGIDQFPAKVTSMDADGESGDISSNDEEKSVGKILQLLCALGAAYKYLCQYRSQDALNLFRELPHTHIASGWVQHQIGRAYFEMSDYQNAQRALETMQRVEPHRMKGLDILSTALWHLKKEVELSDLAQRAVDFDRMAPESWFVVGNCFSFQKEHETAISFFRRAIQLDPSYTYAHTLCGHEYMSNEDFDKSVACYRDAIRVDSRHYNSWYGLGAIYFRQEKFDLAEYHFRRALEINSQSSVLHCHLGMAQHSNGKTQEALDTLLGAFRLDPRNPQAHYQRATIFMSLDKPLEALNELEKVRSAAPREASVHFNMGKVLKRLGRPEKAMRCFLTALDLDPKDNNLIKAAMDRLDEPDIEEEVSVF